MRVDVVVLPDHLDAVAGRVAVVIDVLRGTSTALALLEAGAAEVFLAADLDEARLLKTARDALLIGEEMGRTSLAPGCDLSPSPVALASRDLRGRRVVLCTTNGTLAAVRAHESAAPAVYLGCLGNLGATAAAVLVLAVRDSLDVVVVCAGRRRARRPALDDTYTAGLVVQRMARLARDADVTLSLEDGAAMADRLARGFDTPLEALAASATGHMLRDDGLAADIEWCARTDWSRIAVRARPSPDGFRVVAAAPSDSAGGEPADITRPDVERGQVEASTGRFLDGGARHPSAP
jgi:2-phosphosulfolactate phosphatase